MPTFAELLTLIKNLDSRVKTLEEQLTLCNCECKTIPHIIPLGTHEIEPYFLEYEYDNVAVMSYLNPNDRFPLPACPGEKGIILCKDATVYFTFHDQDSWIISGISRTNNYF